MTTTTTNSHKPSVPIVWLKEEKTVWVLSKQEPRQRSTLLVRVVLAWSIDARKVVDPKTQSIGDLQEQQD